ncbi:MAG: SIS domain-containing protein [Candidatus Uhrbacteria bacterium]
MMESAIRSFPQQFAFEPTIERSEALIQANRFLVVGMGGSALPADLYRACHPETDLVIHRDYGLPEFSSAWWEDRLVVVSSYSGNTEEALDAYDKARSRHLPVAVVAVGGELLEQARRDDVPAIALPSVGIQPRMALGYSLRALAAFIGDNAIVKELDALAGSLDVEATAASGAELASSLADRTPIIYAPRRFAAVAYNWKIKCNETGKIPAFANVFPELNHNEMTGFDFALSARALAERFHVIMLDFGVDDPRIAKRMKICATLYRERGIAVTELEFHEGALWQRVCMSLLMADWLALRLAERSGADPERVPMVEDFKLRMSKAS